MTTRGLAAPYLALQKAVSAGPLALLLLGDDEPTAVSVPAQKIQFPATCRATGEPALLKALLVQIGTGEVLKHVPASAAKIEVIDSAVLRLSVYRDQWPQPWTALCTGPLKAVIEQCRPLQACDQVGCQCSCWHGLAGPRDPDSILELWGRNFTSLQFRPCSAAEAEVFSVFLRVPLALREPLLKHSGTDGVFFEPRDGASKKADAAFSVVWLPKSSMQELALYRQTQEHAIGIARTGTRLGIRRRQAQEEALHNALRPSVPFLGSHADMIFHAGPLLHGVQRHAVAKALRDFGWPAKPLHTIPGGSGEGLWWAVQASSDPPTKVMHSEQGEVLISGPILKAERVTAADTVVAAKSTLRTLTSSNQSGPADPLQKNDPWGKWLEQNGCPRKVPAQPLPQVDEPKPPAAAAASLTPGDLAKLSAHIEHQVLTKVQQQVEVATGDLGHRVSGLESQLGAAQRRVESQEGTLQAMFDAQMTKIEELLVAKRPRKEGNGDL